MSEKKIIKTSAVYAIPWFIIALIIGIIEGMTIGVLLPLTSINAMLHVGVHGIIIAFLTWVVWLGLDVPKHLAKHIK